MEEPRNIFIEATDKTPEIDLNSVTGDIILTGRSIPENATTIYEPLFKWTKEYAKNPRQITNFRINLEYFNTSTSIWIAKTVKALSLIENPDYLMFIHLYFHIEEFEDMENEDIKEVLSPIIDSLPENRISVGVKLHGVDSSGVIMKDTTILV
jgi:hypothetical protein